MTENYLKKELYELIKTDESIFDFIQDNLFDGLWYWDLENPENEWMNARFWTTLGYNPQEMPHKSSAWQDIIFKDDLEVATKNIKKHLEDPNFPFDQTVRYKHKNGTIVWIRCYGKAIRDSNGTATRMIGAHHDITKIQNLEKLAKANQEYLSLNEELRQSNEALNESKEKRLQLHDLMQYIIEHTNSAVAVHDKNYKYLYVSQSYLEQFNVEEIEIIGKHHYEIFPDIPQKWKDVHKKALEGIASSTDEDLFIRADGTKLWTKWKCLPWYEADENIGGFIIYSEVITDRKEMELKIIEEKEKAIENEKFNQMLFDSLPIGLCIVKMTGELVYINDSFAKNIGYSKQETLKLTYWEITPKKYEKQEEIQLKSLEETGFYGPYEKEYIHKSGKSIPVRLSGRMIEKDGEKFIWSSVENISEKKEYEEELLSAKKKAEESDKLKSAFLANMSHEIRTPMNVIIGFSSFLKNENISREDTKKFIDTIINSSNHLLNLINDIIDISKIEAGEITVYNHDIELVSLQRYNLIISLYYLR